MDQLEVIRKACLLGYVDEFKQLLFDGYTPNVKDYTSYYPIHRAARNGYVEIIKLCLGKCPDQLEICDRQMRTPLHHAVEAGHIDCVLYLLEEKACIEKCDIELRTPLLIACMEGHNQIAELLISIGANVNVGDNVCFSPLHHAVKRSDFRIVQQLLDANADIDYVDLDDWTPFYIASLYTDYSMMEFLIRNGANVKHINSKGYTLLSMAVKHKKRELALWLWSKVNDTPTSAIACGDEDSTQVPLPVR